MKDAKTNHIYIETEIVLYLLLELVEKKRFLKMGKILVLHKFLCLVISYLHFNGLVKVAFASMNSAEVIQCTGPGIFQITEKESTIHWRYIFSPNILLLLKNRLQAAQLCSYFSFEILRSSSWCLSDSLYFPSSR